MTPARRFRPVALTFGASLVVAFAALWWVLPSNGPSPMLVAALLAAAYASLAAAMSALAVGWSTLTRPLRVDAALEQRLSHVVLGREAIPLDPDERRTAARYALHVSETQPVVALLLGGFLAANVFLQAGMLAGSGGSTGVNALLLGCFMVAAAVVLPVLCRQIVRAHRYIAAHSDDVRAATETGG